MSSLERVVYCHSIKLLFSTGNLLFVQFEAPGIVNNYFLIQFTLSFESSKTAVEAPL